MSEQTNILLQSGTNELEVLEFLIHIAGKTQSFGINVAKVREVILVPQFDAVPHAHAAVLGLFQLRGKVIPLIDLNMYLNGEPIDRSKKVKVIVTEFNNQNFGFLVQDVVSIHRMSWEQVLPPSNAISNLERDCIVALVPMEDMTIMMLDFEKIVAEINPESAMKESDVGATPELPEGRTYRVMIADDSETIRHMIRNILVQAGFEVSVFGNGKDAWEALVDIKQDTESRGVSVFDRVDLLVSDIEMPSMDGHALCRNIKEDKTLKELPVILFSSLIYEELRKKGEAVGADAQISKPEISSVVSLAKQLITKHLS